MKLSQYDSYNDSGIEFIGLLPSHWSSTALKRVINPVRPITYGIVQAGENVPDGIPYIRPVDMTDERGLKDSSHILRTSPEIAQAYSRSQLEEGDLVCSIGPSFGKLMLVPGWLKGGNLTQGTARLSIDHDHYSKYFFWALRATPSYAQWDSMIGGATFRALNLAPLAETLIPLPPFSEQVSIALFLDRETAKIDRLIEKQQRLIELLEEKRQAVISHAVTKGLNPDAPMKDSGVEWLGEVPENWTVSPLIYSLKAIGDVDHYMPSSIDGGVPYVMTGDLKEKTSDIVFDECKQVSNQDYLQLSKKIKTEKGDVIMARYATIGTVSYVDSDNDFLVSYSCVTIKPNLEKVLGLFLFYYFKSQAFSEGIQSEINTNTQSNVGVSDLKTIKVPLPKINEQKEILDYLQSTLGKFDKLCDAGIAAVKLLKERRTALISAAVTGKIDVRDEVPQDVEEAVAS